MSEHRHEVPERIGDERLREEPGGRMSGPGDVSDAVARAYRTEWAQVLATVVRVSRNFDIAEDCVQDAFAQALLRWGRDGVPDRPGAWLTTVAVREALQAKRRAATAARNLPALAVEDEAPDDPGAGTVFEQLPDDRLRLVFTCCHPALSSEARVALTLRMVCGLTSSEVAKAFLVKEATMQARITRAKKKIADAGIPYRTPSPAELPERLESVFDTVHLVYNAGYVASAGEALMRVDLTDRALQIARMLHELLPGNGDTAALLALLLLTDARRAARLDSAGDLVPLDEQDRRVWDRDAIDEGLALLRTALQAGARGRYPVMACIAAVHAEAATPDETDWEQIVQLYELLLRRWPSPVVALNHAIAVGAADGPAAGLEALEELTGEPELISYSYLPAARADFLRRLGRFAEAAQAYREALLLTGNAVEAAYLRRRLAEVGESP
jgi:RNA polymerase sigma-70 factor (ECF subfamily)